MEPILWSSWPCLTSFSRPPWYCLELCRVIDPAPMLMPRVQVVVVDLVVFDVFTPEDLALVLAVLDLLEVLPFFSVGAVDGLRLALYIVQT